MAIEPVNERPIFPSLTRLDAVGVGHWSVSMIRQLTTVFQQYGYKLNQTLLDEDLDTEGGEVVTIGGDPVLRDSDLAANGGSIPEVDRTNTWVPAQVFQTAPTATGHPLRWDELAANGGTIPETDRDNTFAGSVTAQGLTLKNPGGSTGMELGNTGAASITFVDFHTSGNANDFDARIRTEGGTASTGQGLIRLQAATLQADVPVQLTGESWTAPTLQNGWVNYGGSYATAGYRKTADGMVVVKGLIKDGATTGGTVLFNLPVGYRTGERLIITTSSANAWGRIDVHSNGDVTFQNGSAAWIAINFSFFADQ